MKTLEQDEVFNDEVLEGVEEPLAADAPEPAKKGEGRLFNATPEEKMAEARRKQDHKVGLLIGPKNLVKLRAFGFDVSQISNEALSSGVAHRGLNE